MQEMEDLEQDGGGRQDHPESHHHGKHHHFENCCSHDHQDEIQVYQMSTLAKFAACDAFRREGLAFFAETQWKRARDRFQKMLIYLDYTFPSNSSEEATAASLKKAALLNSTVCLLKQHEYRETISLASQVLREWNDCAQAWYCRGKARRRLNEFAQAREDLKQCLKLVPNNREVQKELHIVDSDERLYALDTAEMARGMFQSTSISNKTASSSLDEKQQEGTSGLPYKDIT